METEVGIKNKKQAVINDSDIDNDDRSSTEEILLHCWHDSRSTERKNFGANKGNGVYIVYPIFIESF